MRENNTREATPENHLRVPIISLMGARRDRNGNIEVAGQKQILNASTAKVSAIGLENTHQIKGPDPIQTTNLRLDRRMRRAILAKKDLRKTSEAGPKGGDEFRYRPKKVSS